MYLSFGGKKLAWSALLLRQESRSFAMLEIATVRKVVLSLMVRGKMSRVRFTRGLCTVSPLADKCWINYRFRDQVGYYVVEQQSDIRDARGETARDNQLAFYPEATVD